MDKEVSLFYVFEAFELRFGRFWTKRPRKFFEGSLRMAGMTAGRVFRMFDHGFGGCFQKFAVFRVKFDSNFRLPTQ